MDSPHTDGPSRQGVALTALDGSTADAVVAVLSRAGVPAWQDPDPDDHGDVVVMVPAGMREEAMREMGRRMEEIADVVRRTGTTSTTTSGGAEWSSTATYDDPDDVRSGRPLMMERFRDLRFVVVVVIGPLLAVTIAGPYLPRSLRAAGFVVIAIGLVVLLVRRRRGRREQHDDG